MPDAARAGAGPAALIARRRIIYVEGYDPQGAVTLQETFVRLTQQEGAKKQSWLEGLFASHPPSAERVAQFEKRIAAATGRRVTMTTSVDPSLIGGAVARVGSIVYDGSIATQLSRMRERLEEQR